MGTVIWHVTMSLDGFIAGPNDSMDWVVDQWSDGGENTRDIDVQRSAVADEVLQAAGAILGGRRWYDVAVRQFNGYDGIYGGQWKGPVFVLTHRPPDAGHHPAITFISGELTDAVAIAQDAAAGKLSSSSGPTWRRSASVPACSTRSLFIWCRFCSATASGSSAPRPSVRSRSSVDLSRPLVRSPICGFQFGTAARPGASTNICGDTLRSTETTVFEMGLTHGPLRCGMRHAGRLRTNPKVESHQKRQYDSARDGECR